MRYGYFDCFSGAAGDMILGAMVDAGFRLEALQSIVSRLNLRGVQVSGEKVRRGGMAATQIHVDMDPAVKQPERHLADVLEIIRGAGLSDITADRAERVFHRLAEAEAKVHGTTVDHVHFHEVGAADAIVDIVGACAGMEALGLDTILCSAIPTGSGTVHCAHGVMPVPAPATAELLRGIPLASCDEESELTTPTGAALLGTLAESFGPAPAMQMEAIGYGAGTRENRSRPNVLRLMVGEAQGDTGGEEADQVVILEAQIDDATGQALGHAAARVLEAGALDSFTVPIMMKKGRPGQLFTVLCRPEDVAAVEDIVFRETTTFGIRRHECLRTKLARLHETVQTEYGPVRIKLGRRGEELLQAWPEYEDCAVAARASGAALRVIQEVALREWAECHGRHARGDE